MGNINIHKIEDALNRIKSRTDAYETFSQLGSYEAIRIKDTNGTEKRLVLPNKNIGDIMRNTIKDVLRTQIDEAKLELERLVNVEPSIIKSIRVNHFDAMEKKNWDYTYWFVDIHSTILIPTYEKGNIGDTYYPHAKKVLQLLTLLDSVKLIMYTCSHPEEIDKYVKFFAKDNIRFDFINKNPDVNNDAYGNYEEKPYINVLLDDKAGFDAENDWAPIYRIMIEKNKK